MTDTPLYDATLSDLLQRARQEAEIARARCALAEGRTEVAEQVEERVRATLALDAPPLPALEVDVEEPDPFLDGLELPERVAPPVPSMEELLRSSPGINRFLDSLLGAPER